MELLKFKWLPCLYYGSVRSLSGEQIVNEIVRIVLNGVIRKIFVTKSIEVVNDCLSFFNCVVSDAIYNRKLRFLSKLKYSDSKLFSLVTNKICSELSIVERYTACKFSAFHTTLSLLLFFFLVVLCVSTTCVGE